MIDQHEGQSKTRRFFAILGAWLLLPILGIMTLAFSLLLGGVMTGENSEETLISRFGTVVGTFGLITLLLLIALTWHLRRRSFFQHLLIGLFIGTGLYGLILTAGAIGFVSVNSSSSSMPTECTNLKEQFMRAQSAVVPILTENGTGTGFAVRDGHTIVTAYHVVESASNIKVNFLDDERPMTVTAIAPEFDLALLHVEKPTTGFMSLTQEYEVADPVYAFGYPGNKFDAGQASLSSGILSRVLSNDDLKLNSADTPVDLEMVQSDMALNPGNSGGPVFSKCGVIGVVSAKSNTQEFAGISSEEGINYGISSKTLARRFALPINNP